MLIELFLLAEVFAKDESVIFWDVFGYGEVYVCIFRGWLNSSFFNEVLLEGEIGVCWCSWLSVLTATFLGIIIFY
jgi:hypothetical protein